MQSFSYQVKSELCRVPVQRVCCARAEAYGVLLYCNTFNAREIRIITENPEFARRLPKLFHRAFSLRFDRLPQEQAGREKLIFQITDPAKLERIISQFGYEAKQTLALHINFGVLEEDCCRTSFLRGAFLSGRQRHRPGKALPPGACRQSPPGQPGAVRPTDGDGFSAPDGDPGCGHGDLFQAERAYRGSADQAGGTGGRHGHHDHKGGQGHPKRRQPRYELRHCQCE